MEPAVSSSLLERMLIGFKFDPELAKDINFDDFVEQQPVPLVTLRNINYDEDEEYTTDQLLLAASQAYEESVASEPSQQGNPVMVVVK